MYHTSIGSKLKSPWQFFIIPKKSMKSVFNFLAFPKRALLWEVGIRIGSAFKNVTSWIRAPHFEHLNNIVGVYCLVKLTVINQHSMFCSHSCFCVRVYWSSDSRCITYTYTNTRGSFVILCCLSLSVLYKCPVPREESLTPSWHYEL